ncbi:beta strand repeat-containing protein [Tenacibaculum insulae]|uniref:beta strand repeat-containing protein n=1 Tax=Tenacibaculum insulae TaxID=2029677 RepID=UPI003AB2A684
MVTYNCDGTGNITITAVPLPTGTATYTYTLLNVDGTAVVPAIPSNTTGIFTNVTAEDYIVDVAYGSSCTKDIDVTVESGQELRGASVATPVTCNGENDGTIVITVNNLGSTVANNYEYSIDGGTNWLPLGGTSTTPLTVSGLIAGTYNVEVRETGNASCEVSAGTVTVNEPTVVTVVSVAETKGITCRLPAGATLEPTANGGNGAAYTYELFNNAGATGAALQTTAPFTDVAAGNYWVVATDVTGVCASVPYAVTVTAPTTLSVVASSVVCYDGSNGEVTVNITGGELPFAVSLNGAAPVSINTTSYTFTGQSAQNHVITVTDNNGCTATDDTDILAPLSGTVTPTDANCAVNSGQIVVSGSGGTGAGTYEYAIVADTVVPVAGDYAAGNSPAKVAPGTYDVYIQDGNGCSAVFQDIVISQIPNPTASTVVTQPLCNADTGSFSLTFGAGESPYDIAVVVSGGGTAIAPQTGVTGSPINFTGLNPGTYDVTVTDANNCSITAKAVITAPPLVTGGGAVSTDFACSGTGVTQGTITFTEPSGGTGSGTYTYYYGLDGSGTFTSTTSTTVTGLAAGTYDVKVGDSNGCELIYTDVTIAPLPAEPDLSEVVTYNCDGTGNITITAVPLPTGTATYTYTLLNVDGTAVVPAIPSNTTGIFTNVTAEDYIVDVAYGSSCTKDIDVTVESGQELRGASVATPVTCNGGNDGTIVITVENLTSTAANSYEYSIDGTTWLPIGGTSTTPLTVSGLIAGTYNVEVRETGNASCEVSAGTVTVNEPTVVTVVSVAETKGITCRLPAGATLEPTANGGNGAAYTYELFNNAGATGAALQTTAPFTDVAAGNYWVVATDVTGVCASVPYAVTVTAPTTLSVVASSVVCYDGSNGEVTVNITGGELPFAVSLNGAAPVSINTTSYTFTGQSAQNHVITVTDNNGCTATDDTDILSAVSGTVTPTDANCNVNSGQIVVSGSGGTGAGTYEYAIVADTVVPVAGDYAAGNSPAKVAPGTYDVYIQDGNGCSAVFQDIVISQIPNPTASTVVTQPLCNADTGSFSLTFGAGESPYDIAVVVSGGGTAIAPQTGVTGSPINFTGLNPGTYDVTVTDANNCSITAKAVITAPPLVTGGGAVSTDFACSGTGVTQGTITFTEPSGGTGSGTYTYYYGLDGSGTFTSTTSTTVTGLAAGTYDVKVGDANGCELNYTDVTIAPLPAEPDLSEVVTYNCDGTGNITITAVPLPTGTATYTYTLLNVDGTAVVPAIPSNTTGIFTNVTAEDYIVDVAYGSSCTKDIDVTVESGQELRGASVATPVTCNGGNDGTIVITVENLTSTAANSYEYSIDGTTWLPIGGTSTTPLTVSGLIAGTYNVEVRETGNASCEVSAGSVTIIEPAVVLVTDVDETAGITCVPATGATLSPTANGGNGGAYTYELFVDNAGVPGVSLQTAIPFTNVGAGNYWVVATDVTGTCTSAPYAVTVTAPTPLTVDATSVACYDGTNGTVTVAITGGELPFGVSLNGAAAVSINTTSYTFTGQSAQNHVIVVTDNNGCTATDDTDIYPVLEGSVDITNASCSDGSIQINSLGGNGTHVYSVVPANDPVPVDATFNTTNPISNPAGTYDVYIRDNNGAVGYCEFLIEDVVIANTPQVDITPTANQPICNGNLGSIDVIIADGQAPYDITVVVSGGGTAIAPQIGVTNSPIKLIDLNEGTYDITVTDALGCSETEQVVLIDPVALIVDIVTILPPGCLINPADTGFNFINVDPADYAPNTLQYSLDGGASWVDANTLADLEIRGLNSGDIVRPALRTSDGVGGAGNTICIDSFGQLEIPYNVSGIVVTITPQGNCADGYEVLVRATGGSGNYLFSLNDSSLAAGLPTNNGNSDEYEWTGLIPGVNYDFFVRDVKATPLDETDDCIELNNDPVDTNPFTDVQITGVVDLEQCSGASNGQITFTLNDSSGTLTGQTINWVLHDANTDTALPITGSQANTDPIVVGGLPRGSYYIIISIPAATAGLSTECSWGSADYEIQEGSPITGSLDVENNITCNIDGSIAIIATGGFPGYTYTVNSYETGNVGNSIPFTLSGDRIKIDDATLGGVTSVDVEVLVTDTNGCTENFGPVTLTLSPSPTITAATGNSCTSNKSIEITVAGGTPPYRYSVDGGTTYSPTTTDTTYTIDGLTTGTYNSVQVIDANGCINVFATSVELYDIIDFNINLVTLLDCVPNEGEYEIAITSGSNGDYTFDIQDSVPASVDNGTITAGNTTGNFNIPAGTPGTYSVIVTDVNSGCSITKPLVVAAAVVPTFTGAEVDAICEGESNGRIDITTTAGVIPVTYVATTNPGGVVTGSWDAGASAITGLPAGTYDVIGTGANGCTSLAQTFTIDDYDAVFVPALTVNAFNCTAGTNTTNSATLVFDSSLITGGSGNYTIALFDTNGTVATGNDTAITSGLSISGDIYTYTITDETGDDYYIRVVDNAGCENVSVSATLPAFERLTDITANLVTELDCNNEEEITVVFNATIPVTGAEITIVGDVTGAGYAAIAGVDSGVVTTVPYTLPADTYTITVTHPSTGCELSTRYLVEEPVDHIVSVTPVSSVSCFGGNDGSVSFVIDTTTPYSGAYTYEVLTPALASLPTPITGIGTDASVAEVVSGLAAGDYVIRVTMTATPDCVRDSNVFTIAGPTATMVVTPTLNPISCIGGSDGSISVLATGGWGDYEYRLIDGTIAVPGAEVQAYSGSNLFENLDAGAYVIYVRDREGCELPTEVSLVDPTQVTFTLAINHNACSADGGVITVNAANGTGSYRYILLDAAGTTELRNQLDPNNSFVGLAAGDYNVRVEDSNGCGAAATQSATINPDLDFNINLVTLLDCVPNEGEYEIAITSGSNGDYTFDIQDSVPASVDNGTITAGNTTGNFNIPAGTPGTYSVIVTDVNSGCSITKPLVVAAAVVPTFTGAEVDAICEGESNGRIDITTTAGVIPVTYVATTNPGGVVTGSWDAGASAITGLPAGTYDVIGTGANGCTSLAQTFTIDDYDAVFVPALTVNAFNCTAGTNTTNSATLVFDSSLITGGSGNYTIALFDTNGTVATGNDTAITSGLSISGDIYTYTITDETGDDYYIRVVDNAGCENVSVSATLPAFERLTDITANLVTELDCNNEEEITVVFNATIPVTGAEITIVGDVTGAGYAAIAGVDSGVVTTVPYTLPADTYTITVTHPSTGCELSTRYLVEEPVDHIVSVTPVSSVSCFGGNDGSVSFVIDTTTPYSGAYTYEVLTPALASLPTPITGIGTDASVAEVVSGLAAGDYVIRVTMTATPDCVRDSNVFTIGSNTNIKPNKLYWRK